MTPLEVIGLGFAALGFLFAAVAALRVQPAFVQMFQDFGGSLPWLTRVCIQPWFPFIFPACAAALTTTGMFSRAASPIRAALFVGNLTVLLAGGLIFLFGMYLPIFSIAGSIK